MRMTRRSAFAHNSRMSVRCLSATVRERQPGVPITLTNRGERMNQVWSNLKRPCGVMALLAVPLMLTGCLSLTPRYHRPAMPVPDVFSVQPAAGAASAGLDWREVFVHPGLQQTIETALQNNRNLRVAILRVSESQSLRNIRRADRLPGLNASGVGVRAGVPDNLGLPGLPGVLSVYDASVGATWELDFWGRVRSLDAAALEGYLASDAARRAFTVSVVAEVANAWLQARELDERIELARRSTQTREDTFRIFRRRYEEGSATRLELAQVETLLTQAQALRVQLEQAREVNLHALSLLMGVSSEPQRFEHVLDSEEAVRAVGAGLPSGLLTNRPDIVSAEHRLKAAHANIGAARAAFFPQVTLTGNLGTASTDLDGLFQGGSRTWSFMPSISVPIFTGGRLRSNLNLAEVRRDIAVADYESTIQGAFRDVADALSAQKWLTEQVSIQQHALAAQQERARLAQLRYDSGAATYLEILDSQRDLLSAEQGLVQTRRALQSARVSLFAALGGGALGVER